MLKNYLYVYSEKVELSENLGITETTLKSRKNESAEFEQQLNAVRNKRQEVSDNLHQIDIKRNETTIRFENLVQHIKEEYNLELVFLLLNYNFV